MAYPINPNGAAPHTFVVQGHGTCENCGEEDTDLCCLQGYMWLCEDCFADVDFCDVCGEGYVAGAIEFVETSGGRYVCEYCAESLGLLGEEEEDEDE